MKKFMKLILCCTLVSILSLAGISQVSALEDGASSRAIETYTRSTNITLNGDDGYVKMTIYISHNMTTGKSWLTKIACQEHFDVTDFYLDTVDFYSNPALNTYFQGAIKVKITYKYKDRYNTYTKYGYIQL